MAAAACRLIFHVRTLDRGRELGIEVEPYYPGASVWLEDRDGRVSPIEFHELSDRGGERERCDEERPHASTDVQNGSHLFTNGE